MRILITSMSIDTRGGMGIAQKATLMARALLHAGEQVTILTCDGLTATRREELQGAEIVQLPLLYRRSGSLCRICVGCERPSPPRTWL